MKKILILFSILIIISCNNKIEKGNKILLDYNYNNDVKIIRNINE